MDLTRLYNAAYKIDLSNTQYNIRPVIHISNLKPYVENENFEERRVQPESTVHEGETIYKVDHILSHRTHRNKIQYLVKLKGFTDADAQWYDSSRMSHLKKYIDDYKASLPHPSKGEDV